MKRLLVGAWVAWLAGVAWPAGAGEVRLTGLAGGHGGLYTVRVTSLLERKFHRIVRQQFDFSCGSAALATLLTYHYDDPVTEQQAFAYMWQRGNRDKIRHEGFSLLDIKRYLEAHGYRADGFQTNLETVARVGVPVIVLVTDRGYHHFVVLTGLRDQKVLVADPAVGARVLSAEEFKAIWRNNIVFAITNKRDAAQFNTQSDWTADRLAPLGMAISRQGLSRMLMLRGPNDF